MGFRKPITILRESGGGYVNGIWQAGTVQQIAASASIQPVTGEKLQALPENRRNGAVYALFSDFEFISGGEPGIQPDKIMIRTHEFECFQCEPWQNGVIPHFKGVFSAISKH